MSQEAIARLQSVTKVYPNSVKALDGIDLEISSGEILAVTGSSGSGKTTLLNILGLLDSPSSGIISFDGKEIDNCHAENKFRTSAIGYIFQLFYLIEHLTAAENVELALYPSQLGSKERCSRAIELLGKVDMTEKRDQKASTLSGGEKQRVAIARAIANNPKLILADEPTGNLDSSSGKNVIRLLKQLNETDNTAIVIVTHDPAITSIAHRNFAIRDGRFVN